MWCAWRWRCLRCSVFDGLCSLGFFFFVNLCVSTNNCSHVTPSAHWLTPPVLLLQQFPVFSYVSPDDTSLHTSVTLFLFGRSFLFPLSFLFSFLSLSPSVRVSAPPSHLLPFSPSPWGLCALLSRAEAPRPLCPALWLAERKPHGWKEWAAPAPLSAQLFGCSNGITLQLQWEESRGRERHSERGERRRAQNGHG